MRTGVSIIEHYVPPTFAVITRAQVPCEEWFDIGCYNCDAVLGAGDCNDMRNQTEPVFCSPACKAQYEEDNAIPLVFCDVCGHHNEGLCNYH